jgi:arsenate reductase
MSYSNPVVVYTYSGCSTCRDAVGWLREHGVAFEERPIYDRPPTIAELKRMLGHVGSDLRRLFNTSGLEYRRLELKAKLPAMSEAEALRLLASNGRLVKRPLLLGAHFGLVGFKPDAWAAVLT